MRSCIRRVVCLFAHSSTLVQASFPARPGPRGTHCSVTFGITLAWNFEAAESVQPWWLSQTAPDVSTWETMWNWDAHRGARCASPSSTCGGLMLHSAEFLVRSHQSSEVHHSYSIICTSLWMLLRTRLLRLSSSAG